MYSITIVSLAKSVVFLANLTSHIAFLASLKEVTIISSLKLATAVWLYALTDFMVIQQIILVGIVFIILSMATACFHAPQDISLKSITLKLFAKIVMILQLWVILAIEPILFLWALLLLIMEKHYSTKSYYPRVSVQISQLNNLWTILQSKSSSPQEEDSRKSKFKTFQNIVERKFIKKMSLYR